MDLPEAARLMEDVEYLKASRERNKEWTADFRNRYGIRPHKCDHLTPSERRDNAQHHAEWCESRH